MSKCIKQTILDWQNFTFQERWSLHASKYEIKVSDAVKNILSRERFNINHLRITGFAVEGLPRNGEQRTYPVRFAGGFHDVINEDDFDPVLYMLELTKRVYQLEQLNDYEKLAGFLARAFRSLTSFLKEPAFADDLASCLVALGVNCQISMSQQEDAEHHTDVKAVIDGKVFRFWIYQCSDNGIPHDIDRVSGRRGKLPEGIHVLCPLHTGKAIQLGTFENRRNRSEDQLCKWEELLAVRANKNTRGYRDLADRIEMKRQEIVDLKAIIANIYRNSGVDIINGFYLYPKEYVENVARRLTSQEMEPDDYNQIHSMMEAPRNYVSELNFFKI
jgi:hypothetical protein